MKLMNFRRLIPSSRDKTSKVSEAQGAVTVRYGRSFPPNLTDAMKRPRRLIGERGGTRTAEDAKSYDRATELEMAGATVLDLKPTEWRDLALAA
jgi:hypothetical protein